MKSYMYILLPSSLFLLTNSLYAFPTDESAWLPILKNGSYMEDVPSDGSTNGRNLVGDDTYPVAFVHYDSVTEIFSVRLRLDTDPRSGSTLGSYGWGILLDVDENWNSYDYSIMLDGVTQTLIS